MKRFLRILISTVLVLFISLPFLTVALTAICLPSQYDEVFTHALSDKLARLEAIDEDKIVIVGGSSTSFGIDSELIEKYTGMPVVNMGVYAALGTKLMLDLTEPYIEEGDVVILAPELDAETLSMYFNAKEALTALDGNLSYLRHLGSEHYTEILGAGFEFAFEKLHYFFTESPSPEGVYNSKSFDSYGDIEYQRDQNTMRLYYDPNTPIALDKSILDPEFASYLNSYISSCESKGARVVFAYCPINELAVEGGYDRAAARELESYLMANINCDFVGYLEDSVYSPGYFYDTNFHLNDAGVTMHTVYMLQSLLPLLGIDASISDTIPAEPPLPNIDVRYFGEDENAVYFNYVRTASGAYMITGVKDEYKNMTELTIPVGYDGFKVEQIGYGALSGTAARKLILTAESDSFIFSNGAFFGAKNLTSLVIEHPYAVDILPPADFVGVHSSFKVYVPDGSDYREDYYWRELGLDFEYID